MSTYVAHITDLLPDVDQWKQLARRVISKVRTWAQRLTTRTARPRTLLHDASTWTLSLIASNTGYDITLNTARLITEYSYAGIVTLCRYTTRAIGHATRAVYSLIRMFNTELAARVEDTIEEFIVEPTLDTALATDSLIRQFGEQVWSTAHQALVERTTTGVARGFAGIISIHTLTQAAIAGKAVQLAPWLMSPIVWITNPTNALITTGLCFIAALAFQTMMSRPQQPTPQEPETVDLSEVISRLHINVDLNGDIHVNGLPDTMPDELEEQLVSMATAAAQSRLDKIRRTRSTLTRDDRRLLTKVARTALRDTLLRDIHAA